MTTPSRLRRTPVQGPRRHNVTWVSGDVVLEHDHSDYGLAAGDLDGDGDWDLAIATSGSPTQPGFQVLENLNSSGHYIGFRLEGTASNRSAIGARIEVILMANPLRQSIAAKGTAVPVRSTSMSVGRFA